MSAERAAFEILELHGGEEVLEDLREILFDAVSGGFSIGFLEQISAVEADAFWTGLLEDLGPNRRIWVARSKGSNGRVLGTVQFERCAKPNGRHRAEVQKLLVHSKARGLGLGRRLMETLEAAAKVLKAVALRFCSNGPSIDSASTIVEAPTDGIHEQLARASRTGISLIEILISMFVLLFGLMGVAAIFPVGSHYTVEGEKFDFGSNLARNAFEELRTRGSGGLGSSGLPRRRLARRWRSVSASSLPRTWMWVR